MPPNKPLQPTAFGGGCAAGVRHIPLKLNF
jgi:hypothetical protein